MIPHILWLLRSSCGCGGGLMLLLLLLRRWTDAAVVAAAKTAAGVNRIVAAAAAAVRLLRWCPWLFLVLVDFLSFTILTLGLILLRRRISNGARR